MDHQSSNFAFVNNIQDIDTSEKFLTSLPAPIASLIEKVNIKIHWFYTGQDSQFVIIARIMRNGHEICEDRDLVGFADRENKEKSKQITVHHGESFLANYQKGDQIFIYYQKLRGEGRLQIKNFELLVLYKNKNLNTVKELDSGIRANQIENINNHNSTEDEIHLTNYAEPIKGTIDNLQLYINWKDQGWGNQKGRIIAKLFRNGQLVSQNQNVFGQANHQQEEKEVKIKGNEDFLLDHQVGDEIQFYYLVGGGGGHTLHITKFTAQIYYQNIVEEPKESEQLGDHIRQEVETWEREQNQLIELQKQQGQFEHPQFKLQLKRQFSNSIEEQMTCKICYQNRIQRIYECGHAMICDDCFNQLKNKRQCPICKQNGNIAKKIFFS